MSVCFYFQVHQPFRLRQYSVFDIGKDSQYFDEEQNSAVMRKVAGKCYLPMNKLLLDLLEQHEEFKVSFSLSGVVIEQMRMYAPEVLESFRQLAATGRVEFLAETYYHSLSFLYDKEEFDRQVRKHTDLIESEFGQTPKIFRNTELIYNNEIARHIEKLGFAAMLAEGWDPPLGWRSPNFVYKGKTEGNLSLLLKNYRLSDDIAFRFGNRGWKEWPLTVQKYVRWLNDVNGSGETVNLFMDYETFGEHQWADTGIFDFMRDLPGELLRHPDNEFKTVGETVMHYEARDEIDMHAFVSWADVERDLSAWLGNSMQQSAISELYKLGRAILQAGRKDLMDAWRKLTTSDHAYYMCTKWFADGDVHKYFNPYESPYEAYIAFMNVLHDLALRTRAVLESQGRAAAAKQAQIVTGTPSTLVLPFVPGNEETSVFREE